MGSLTATQTGQGYLWPRLRGPDDLAEVERTPLSDRGLPASTYKLVTRAASLWPDRTAVSVLPAAQRFHTPPAANNATRLGTLKRPVLTPWSMSR